MAVAGFFCTADWFCDGVECACFMESHAMDMDIESLSLARISFFLVVSRVLVDNSTEKGAFIRCVREKTVI